MSLWKNAPLQHLPAVRAHRVPRLPQTDEDTTLHEKAATILNNHFYSPRDMLLKPHTRSMQNENPMLNNVCNSVARSRWGLTRVWDDGLRWQRKYTPLKDLQHLGMVVA